MKTRFMSFSNVLSLTLMELKEVHNRWWHHTCTPDNDILDRWEYINDVLLQIVEHLSREYNSPSNYQYWEAVKELDSLYQELEVQKLHGLSKAEECFKRLEKAQKDFQDSGLRISLQDFDIGGVDCSAA